MTQKEIEKAAAIYISTGDILDRSTAYYSFIAGANHRQIEVDTLTARIAQLEADCKKYQRDIAEGLKREEIARKVIEEKRKSVKP